MQFVFFIKTTYTHFTVANLFKPSTKKKSCLVHKPSSPGLSSHWWWGCWWPMLPPSECQNHPVESQAVTKMYYTANCQHTICRPNMHSVSMSSIRNCSAFWLENIKKVSVQLNAKMNLHIVCLVPCGDRTEQKLEKILSFPPPSSNF